jgi:general secretion pathway protein G
VRVLLEKLREARRRDEGFTLIELLIVILILGILAGIAVFASGPFRTRAENACVDANTEIAAIEQAALDAGVVPDPEDLDGNLYVDGQGPDCEGTGSGPGGPTPWEADSAGAPQVFVDIGVETVTYTGASEGNLLVAVYGHRQTPDPVATTGTGENCGGFCNSSDPNPPPAVAGWTYQGHSFYQTDISVDRRGMAVYTQVVAAAGDVDFTVDWPGVTQYDLIIAEFSRTSGTWANTGVYEPTDVAGASPWALNAADGGTGSALQLAGVVGRAGPDSGTFEGFEQTWGSDSGSAPDVGLYLGYDSVEDAGSLGATFNYTGATHVSGFVLFMR